MDIDRAKEIFTDNLIESTFQDAEPETYTINKETRWTVELDDLPEELRRVNVGGSLVPLSAFFVEDCSVIQDEDGEPSEIDWSALCFRVSVEIPGVDTSKILDQRMAYFTDYVMVDIDHLSSLQEEYLTCKLISMWRGG